MQISGFLCVTCPDSHCIWFTVHVHPSWCVRASWLINDKPRRIVSHEMWSCAFRNLLSGSLLSYSALFGKHSRHEMYLSVAWWHSRNLISGPIYVNADRSGHAGLLLLACWNCGFESRRRMDVCLCVLSGRGL